MDDNIVYPESDGRPIAESTLQFDWIATLHGNTCTLLIHNPNVFVAADLLWYPLQGDNILRTAPDLLVAFGRPKGHRRSYLQWREGGIAPQVVWEVLPPTDRPDELEAKFAFYERFGVEEYYQSDPHRGTLRGWLRSSDRLVEIDRIAAGWVSPRLDVRMELKNGELQVFFPDGRSYRTFLELGLELQQQGAWPRAYDQESHRADQERQRADKLAERLRALGIDPDAP